MKAPLYIVLPDLTAGEVMQVLDAVLRRRASLDTERRHHKRAERDARRHRKAEVRAARVDERMADLVRSGVIGRRGGGAR